MPLFGLRRNWRNRRPPAFQLRRKLWPGSALNFRLRTSVKPVGIRFGGTHMCVRRAHRIDSRSLVRSKGSNVLPRCGCCSRMQVCRCTVQQLQRVCQGESSSSSDRASYTQQRRRRLAIGDRHQVARRPGVDLLRDGGAVPGVSMPRMDIAWLLTLTNACERDPDPSRSGGRGGHDDARRDIPGRQKIQGACRPRPFSTATDRARVELRAVS